MKISGKKFFITGSGRRLGRAILEGLLAQNAQIIAHCHSSRKELEELKRENSQILKIYSADFSNFQEVVSLANRLQVFNDLEGIILNSAVFFPDGKLDEFESRFETLISINLKAPLYLAKQLGQRMKSQKGGIIILLADIYGKKPLRGHSIYSITKAGVLMAVRSLALELAPEVRVNSISPGYILEPVKGKGPSLSRIPLQKKGDPQNIVETVKFLISNDYITGIDIPVDGGKRIQD
ncbi:MAG: SDR family oxidoreductase [Planctomycetota bacterium]|nr:MAG: SDR family oxidoreductase [Planctomycetota bacterium]